MSYEPALRKLFKSDDFKLDAAIIIYNTEENRVYITTKKYVNIYFVIQKGSLQPSDIMYVRQIKSDLELQRIFNDMLGFIRFASVYGYTTKSNICIIVQTEDLHRLPLDKELTRTLRFKHKRYFDAMSNTLMRTDMVMVVKDDLSVDLTTNDVDMEMDENQH